MTTDADTPPIDDRRQRQRHRLVPRGQLAVEYEARYGSAAVSEYGLAVRDVVEGCARIGPIDTWRKLAELICQGKPARDRARWRKTLSRHFTAESKGPPWQTVMLVVKHALPEAEREAALTRFGRLYLAARGDKPPTGEVPEPASGNRAAPDDPDGRGQSLAEVTWQNERLRRMVATKDREIVRLRAELRDRTDGGPRSRSVSDELPRQRGSAPQPTRKAQNPGHFPARRGGPDAPPPNWWQPSRTDLVIPGRFGPGSAEATYWIDHLPWHTAQPAPRNGRRGIGSIAAPARTNLGSGPTPATPSTPPTTY
jgi:hypothetical protein